VDLKDRVSAFFEVWLDESLFALRKVMAAVQLLVGV